jgi:hypothetical protein
MQQFTREMLRRSTMFKGLTGCEGLLSADKLQKCCAAAGER